MKHVHEVLQAIVKAFQAGGMSDPKRQAEELLCDLLHCARSDLYTQPNRSLTEQEIQQVQLWIARRLTGEPLPYLAGRVHFYGCVIEVNPSVLIPRQETEILVDKVVTQLKKEDLKGKVLLDLCCGSGAIGIAIKKALPVLSVYLSDYSEQAIELAARNAALNQVEVICLKGDLFAPFQGKKAHYFTCNPPYISENEYVILSKEVREHEPQLALVAGPTGLEIYERIARDLPHYLEPGGKGWLEIGYQQGAAVKGLFEGSPWKKSWVENDWAGHNRFFFLEIE